ncbi:Enzymatic polyprotein, partial [Mucuna pruriens]
MEYEYPGTRNDQIINILKQNELDEHIKKGYNYIHLGLIQIAAKPNYRLGINSPILMMLRDIRCKKFKDSIISIVESNLHDDPAFFNCYPNFSMNLRNDKTIQIPKKLSHEEIISKVPEEWLLEEIIEEPKIYHNQIREIIQDGPNIRLKMNRSKSLMINEPQVIYKGQPSRYSIDESNLDLILLLYCTKIIPPTFQLARFDKLRKNPPEWNNEMTQVIIEIKNLVKKLPCLGIPDPNADLIIETDASDIGYGGVLKQKLPNSSKEQVVKYHSEILSIVLCVQKFQNDVFNKKFLIRTDCKAAPSVLTKDMLANPSPRPTNPLVLKKRFIPLYFNTTAQSKSYLITSIPEPSNDPYIEKLELLPIMTLESYMSKEDLKTLVAYIFPKTFHYLPNNQLKTQRFYEFILVDTDSAEITHTRDDQGNMLFSKMKIINILSPQDWNQHLFDSKAFTRQFNPLGYTYYDYIDAWFNTFYIHPEKHSWFIWFEKGIPLKFLKWFVKWFYHYQKYFLKMSRKFMIISRKAQHLY